MSAEHLILPAVFLVGLVIGHVLYQIWRR